MQPTDRLSYCGDLVRRFDRERYLVDLLASGDRREALFAIHAFNHELAKTREVVSEPLLGQVRLQWWREAVGRLFAGDAAPPHEVLQPLAAAIERFRLTGAHFDRLIEARERDLDDAEIATTADFTGYAEATCVPLLDLALEVLEADSAAARQAARHAGTAWGVVGLLRAVPFHATRGRLLLPRDLLAEKGVAPSEVLAGRQPPTLKGAVATLASAAAAHVAEARRLRSEINRQAVPALLGVTLVDGHLRRLRRVGYDVFDARCGRIGALAPLRLTWCAAMGRY